MNGRGRNSATGWSSEDSVVGTFVAARYSEGGPAGSFDDRSLGRRRRSLIIVGSRDADERARWTKRWTNRESREKGREGQGELEVGPYRVRTRS